MKSTKKVEKAPKSKQGVFLMDRPVGELIVAQFPLITYNDQTQPMRGRLACHCNVCSLSSPPKLNHYLLAFFHVPCVLYEWYLFSLCSLSFPNFSSLLAPDMYVVHTLAFSGPLLHMAYLSSFRC